MRTLKEFIAEKQEMGSQYYAELDIENTEKLYQAAMRAKNAKDLEKSMMKMTSQFDDAKSIDFKEVNWDEVYKQLNEKAEAITEGKLNYDKIDLGDVWEEISQAFNRQMGHPSSDATLSEVFEELIKTVARGTLETWNDNSMEIDEDVRADMEAFAKGSIKVKTK